VMVAMMLGLVPFGWLYLIQRVFYAYEDARTPFRLQLVVTVVATVANLVAATVDPVHTGIVVGLGQTLSNLSAALLGFVLLRRRLGSLGLHTSIRGYVRLGIASVAAGLLTWLGLRAMEAVGVDATSWTGAFVEVVVGGGGFIVIALGLAHAMRVQEVGLLLDPLLRRLRRRPS